MPQLSGGMEIFIMIFEKLQAILAEQFTMAASDITETTNFSEDLNADSIDLVELFMTIEDEFDIGEVSEEDARSITTVGVAVEFIKNRCS